MYQFSAQKEAEGPMIHHEVYGLFLQKRTLCVENTEFGLISKCILPSSVVLLLFLPVCAPGSQTQHPESCACVTMPTFYPIMCFNARLCFCVNSVVSPK